MPQQEFNLKDLTYDPLTGNFTKWDKPVGWRRKDGYVFISRGRQLGLVLAHRLAWYITYKKWPTEVDHIDGNPSNNAISNLREVDHQTNLLNSKVHRTSETPGVPTRVRRPYRSRHRSFGHLFRS